MCEKCKARAAQSARKKQSRQDKLRGAAAASAGQAPAGAAPVSDPGARIGSVRPDAAVAGAPAGQTAAASGVNCDYVQESGRLTCTDNATQKTVVDQDGYSGHGDGVNNPDKQCEKKVGPLPAGEYAMGDARDGPSPLSIPLTPTAGTDTCGRGGFLIHGDNDKGNRSASEGCIIVPRDVRKTIDDAGGGTLTVRARSVPAAPPVPEAAPAEPPTPELGGLLPDPASSLFGSTGN